VIFIPACGIFKQRRKLSVLQARLPPRNGAFFPSSVRAERRPVDGFQIGKNPFFSAGGKNKKKIAAAFRQPGRSLNRNRMDDCSCIGKQSKFEKIPKSKAAEFHGNEFRRS
jgi:hypothetical protein